MPTSLLYADTSLPTAKDGASAEEKTEEIINYLYMLLEQLRYTLGNLGEENFNDAEKERMGKALTEPVYVKIANSENTLKNEMKVTAEGLAATIAKVDAYGQSITKLQATAEGLESAVFVTDGNGQITSQTLLRQFADSLTLGVITENGVSKIKLTGNGVNITSTSGIDLSGMVTFSDLSGSGSTTINGDNITTGMISSRIFRTLLSKINTTFSIGGSIEMFYSRSASYTNSRLMAEIRGDADGKGTPQEAGLRLFIATHNVFGHDVALKLLSAGSMSLESGGMIYMNSLDEMSFQGDAGITITANDGVMALTAYGQNGGISMNADKNVWIYANGDGGSGSEHGVVEIRAEKMIKLNSPSVVVNGTEI